MKILLVGVKQDDGSVDHIRNFTNPTWALKYAKGHGELSVYAEVDVVFNNTPPAPKPGK